MSWRDSLWAAAAAATTLADQAQSTLTSAAASVQQTYHEATSVSANAYAPVKQDDGDTHTTNGSNGVNGARVEEQSAETSSLSSIAASFPSLAALSSSLPTSLASLNLPDALSSRLSALTDASPPNTAPVPVDSDTEQSEQLISATATHSHHRARQPPHSHANGTSDSDVAVVTLDADELGMPSLVVHKTSLQTPVKLTAHANDSDEAPSLYYTPQQHKAKQQRNTVSNTQSSAAASPEADAHLHSRQQSTVQLFAEQDTVLDSMRGSIARLSELSGDVGRELGEHEAMLAEVNDEMGVSEGLMDTSRKKVERLLKGAPKYHLYLIAVMCLIVLVLLYFILYT